ncbi:phosphopantetheine-binding protein [Paenibacillus sp. HW567]|uniref:phosphopantetheine-binding protein n=1 Tax=Paenibacillus sp. HW567 TaxID=1034769 RepID=UPI00036BC4E8|nr:phosphopantetheine-binding protein [Paenibacillus sp. HW567]
MITKNEIEAQLVQIYLKQMQAVGTGEATVQTGQIAFSGDQISLQEAGINSLGFIRLVVEIENAFQIQFEDDMLDIELFHSMQDLVAYIEREVNGV